MAISYLVKINNNSLPKLKAWKVGRNKLWVDADRNMAGDLTATSLGIYPKIFLEFTVTTEDEMSQLATLFDLPSFTVSWWDVVTKANKSGTYYASDFETPILDVSRGLYDGFSVNLIPYSRMT